MHFTIICFKHFSRDEKLTFINFATSIEHFFGDVVNNKRHNVCLIYVILGTNYIQIFSYLYIVLEYISIGQTVQTENKYFI